VAVWPPTGADPVVATAKQGYYDSMYHATAAVGINTSALIELAIVGRPAFTVLDPEFRATQQGTLHFKHLTAIGGGILSVAESLPEHVEQLAGALTAPGNGRSRNDAFLRAFVRPRGLDRPSAPLVADLLERVPPVEAAESSRLVDRALRAAMSPLTRIVTASGRRPPLQRKLDRWRRRTDKQMRRQIRHARRTLRRRAHHASKRARARMPR